MRLSPKLIAGLRRILVISACMGTLFAAFIVFENWRGDRAWAEVERDLKSRGERLDLEAFQDAAVPEERNFLKAPLLHLVVHDRPGDAARAKLLEESRLNQFPIHGTQKGSLIPLEIIRDHLRKTGFTSQAASDSPAADILAALQPMRELLDATRDAASTRPDAAFEPRTSPLATAPIAANELLRLGEALALRAAAKIELAQPSDAFGDIVATQRLAAALTLPAADLLGQLAGLSLSANAALVINDGSARHVWNDAQLADFQARLSAHRPLESTGHALRHARAVVLTLVDARPSDMGPNFSWPVWFFHGWAQQNKARYCRSLEVNYLSRLVPGKVRSIPQLDGVNRRLVPSSSYVPSFDWLARFTSQNLGHIFQNYLRESDRLSLTVVACALERHRAATGKYPEKLASLTPAFLPNLPLGLFDGEPPRQSVAPDGALTFYYLGQNALDDGGKSDDVALTIPGR